MAIEFRCPNGHRLSCPDQRAGKEGKCPKCNAVFTIPAIGSTPPTESDSEISEPELHNLLGAHASEAAEASAHVSHESDGAPAEGTFAFLCPNGHKLNGPTSLQGRPGKCPHCGARFLVPRIDETEDSPHVEDGDGGSEFAGQMGDEGYESYEDAPSAGPTWDLSDIEQDLSEPADATAQFMSRLFVRLWEQRGEDCVVELLLRNGDQFAPDWFCEQISQGVCGLFAVEDEDGRYSVVAVRWDAIERITLRGVEALPDNLFS